MQVLFNSHYLFRKTSGLGRYAQQLHATLIHIADIQHFPTKKTYEKIKKNKLFRYFFILIAESFFVSLFKNEQNRVVHISPAFSAPTLDRRGTSVVVVHDLAFTNFPACYLFREKVYYALNMFFLRHSKSIVVAPSDYVLQQIHACYGITRSRLRHISPYSSFSPADVAEQENATPYFLMVSNNHPRKNLNNTIDGFLQSSAAAAGYKLLIVGNFEVDPRPDNRLIIVKSNVADDALALLYSQCEALLLFSLSEGFGYPVVEAASMGRPSLTSEVTSMSEFIFSRQPSPAITVVDIAARIDKFMQDAAYRRLVFDDIHIINSTYNQQVFEQKWRAIIQSEHKC